MNSALGKHERTIDEEVTDMDFHSDQEDFSLPRNYQPTGYIDTDKLEQANMTTHLPESNIGYRLLLKMGWSAGQGLGSDLQGRVDPIPIELKMNSLGIGKAEEEEEYHISSTSQRRALDSEKQMEETEEEKNVRENVTQKKEEVKNDIKQILRAFYCELCDKQYSRISEYEQHLQSYDHHHKKRFKDMRDSSKSTQGAIAERAARRERERKREEREDRRMQEAMMKKSGIKSDTIPNVAAEAGIKGAAEGTIVQSNIKGTASTGVSAGGWATVSDDLSTAKEPHTSGWTKADGTTKDMSNVPKLSGSHATIPSSASIPETEKPDEGLKLFSGKNSKPAPKMSFGMNKKSTIKFGFGNK